MIDLNINTKLESEKTIYFIRETLNQAGFEKLIIGLS